MTVVNIRDALIGWYMRRGYAPTGETDRFRTARTGSEYQNPTICTSSCFVSTWAEGNERSDELLALRRGGTQNAANRMWHHIESRHARAKARSASSR
jgi:hypothetical protein